MNETPQDFMSREQAFERFQQCLKLNHYQKRTVENYTRWINRFFDYINFSNAYDLTIFDAWDFLSYLNENYEYEDRTYNLAVYALRLFYDAVLQRTISKARLPRRKTKKIPKPFLNGTQCRELIDHCNDLQLKAAISLAFCSGLRISEISKLQFKDFFKGQKKILIVDSKGNKSRYVPFAQSTAKILREYCLHQGRRSPKPEEFVFPHEKKPGFPIQNTSLTHRFMDYIQTFDFYLHGHSFHSLRHGYATEMAMIGVPLPVIQESMGHASAATTSVYIHCDEYEKELPDLFTQGDYLK